MNKLFFILLVIMGLTFVFAQKQEKKLDKITVVEKAMVDLVGAGWHVHGVVKIGKAWYVKMQYENSRSLDIRIHTQFDNGNQLERFKKLYKSWAQGSK